MDIGSCRLTGEPLDLVLDLGMQPLGNGFVTASDAKEFFFPLQCGFNSKSLLFQLVSQPAPDLMFHQNYAFFSGTSRRMAGHFEELANAIILSKQLSEESLVVELGSNDGILLKHFASRGIKHLGIEPAGDVAAVAESAGISVIREFFSEDLASRIINEHGCADVVLAANVMCHIPDIRDLASGIAKLLKKDGLLIFEDPYLGDVIKLGSYDQIYDEHVFLFSALSVSTIFETVGLELIDVAHQPTHGGSMRYTLAKSGKFQRSVAVESLLAEERELGLHLTSTFIQFERRVVASSNELRSTLEQLRQSGARVAAYGATSKSTTIYNFAKIGPDLIYAVYDNTPAKIGKLTPGVHIPVLKESLFSVDAPTVTFLSAWNHEREILDRYTNYSHSGGRWLSHVPSVRFL